MRSFLGTLHQHGHASTEATILIFDKTIHIGYKDEEGQNNTIQWDISVMDAVYDLPGNDSRLKNHADHGREIIVEGRDAFDFFTEMKAEIEKPWYKKRNVNAWKRYVFLFVIITSILAVLYFFMVPWIAEKMATRVPVSTEEGFGNAIYSAMGLEGLEDPDASNSVNNFFQSLEIKSKYDIRISVVESPIVNAFALPGGRIVVYTGLLKNIKTYPELAALLSHEYSHVNNKHSTRAIFRNLGSRVFIGLLFGNVASVTAILASHADNIKSLKYSRSLENEADEDGLGILMEKNIDPEGFTSLFSRLEESGGTTSIPEFLASHPDIQKRIRNVKELAVGATVTDHPGLKTIFENLKLNLNE